jgi:hypothetical protein
MTKNSGPRRIHGNAHSLLRTIERCKSLTEVIPRPRAYERTLISHGDLHQQRLCQLPNYLCGTFATDFRQSTEGRQVEALATKPFGRNMGTEIAGRKTCQHFVLRYRSLNDQLAAAANHACPVRKQVERLLAGAESRRQEFGIDIEKYHHIRTIDAMQDRFRTDEHRCPGINRCGGWSDFLHQPAGRCLQLVPQSGNANPH